MPTTLRFKTNLNCKTCVAAVKPYLDDDPAISRWEVDMANPEKTLTVHGESVSTEKVKAAVAKAGFKVLDEVANPPPVQPAEEPSAVTYYPLVLILAFLIGIVILTEVGAGGFVWERAMRHFMGGFFVAFSFFKLLDLRGFADSYQMYDVVARRFPVYGFVYPFIELTLGAAYVTGFQPVATNIVTLVVMSVSSVGVIQSLLAKRKIRCACLGTVFNLPMSTVTLIEDALMIVMAAVMLLPLPHDSFTLSEQTHHGAAVTKHGAHHEHRRHKTEPNATKASLAVRPDSIRDAGQPSTLHMTIHGSDGQSIKDFDTVHEEKVHLIIVREGLDSFAHLHPQVDSAGNLVVTYSFPVGGTYHLFADYQQTGKEPAVASAVVQVRGDSPAAPPLNVNVPGVVVADGLRANIALERAGSDREATMQFELSDLNGRSLTDLQPYLGAMGHLVIVSRDGQEYVHAHPQESKTHRASNMVAFHVAFRNSGVYKGWGQFQRGGAVHVVPFVIEVK